MNYRRVVSPLMFELQALHLDQKLFSFYTAVRMIRNGVFSIANVQFLVLCRPAPLVFQLLDTFSLYGLEKKLRWHDSKLEKRIKFRRDYNSLGS